MEALFLGLLYLALHIAVILFVAFIIVWICRIFGIGIDPTVYKVGKIIVFLLILIAIVSWAYGLVRMPLLL